MIILNFNNVLEIMMNSNIIWMMVINSRNIWHFRSYDSIMSLIYNRWRIVRGRIVQATNCPGTNCPDTVPYMPFSCWYHVVCLKMAQHGDNLACSGWNHLGPMRYQYYFRSTISLPDWANMTIHCMIWFRHIETIFYQCNIPFKWKNILARCRINVTLCVPPLAHQTT